MLKTAKQRDDLFLRQIKIFKMHDQATFFVDTDTGNIVVRGPKAREHVFDPNRKTHVTTVNKRSKRAHQGRVSSGRLEPASQEQIDSLKDNGED